MNMRKLKKFLNGIFSIKNEGNHKRLMLLGFKLKFKTQNSHIRSSDSMFDLQKMIDNASVVSFDIFDTLLLRPFVNPVDVFAYIEQETNSIGFKEERIKSEEQIRRELNGSEEVTYDEIYENMAKPFKKLKEVELKTEKQILMPNIEMQKVYDYAIRKNKKVILVSNMYLSKCDLEEILKKNNYINYYKLYVSSHEKLSKNTSNLFKKILMELNVDADKILHIGDNKHDDYEMPKLVNINAFWYTKPIEQFFQHNDFSYLQQLYKSNHENYEISIIISMLMIYWLNNNKQKINENNFWHFLGFLYGGSAAFAYTKFIKKIVKREGIEQLIFVARDGYNLQKIYNKLENEPINNSYVYAPRIFNIKTLTQYESYVDETLNFWGKNNLKFSNLLNSKNIKDMDYTQKNELINEGRSLIKANADEYKEEYTKYVNNLVDSSKKIAVVDTVTGAFSSQNLLQKVFSKNIFGIYWCINYEYNGYKNNDFAVWSKDHVLDFFWDFFEIAITSPELPIKAIVNGKPEYYSNIDLNEIHFRTNLYPKISDGILDFADNIIEIFGELELNFSHEIFYELLKNFYVNLSGVSEKLFCQVYQTYDLENKNYVPHMYAMRAKINKLLFNDMTTKINLFLFGFIPFAQFNLNSSIIKTRNNIFINAVIEKNKTLIKFLGITILKIKRINENKIKTYLFGFIPILKIKKEIYE